MKFLTLRTRQLITFTLQILSLMRQIVLKSKRSWLDIINFSLADKVCCIEKIAVTFQDAGLR